METCKTELLASKSREIELSESLHKYEVRANNSCLRGQDGEAQMMYVLAKMLPNYIQDTHLTAHSGDCIAEIPYKTRSVKMIFDRKNYDEKTMTGCLPVEAVNNQKVVPNVSNNSFVHNSESCNSL